MDKDTKKTVSCVSLFVILAVISVAIITCSLFDTDSSPDIPTDWKKICLEKPWYVSRHYAQTDSSIPEFFTSFSNITFQNKNDNYSVIVKKEDSDIGPFAFTFLTDNSGQFVISQNGTTAVINAIFSDENTSEYKLSLTVPSGKKIILMSNLQN